MLYDGTPIPYISITGFTAAQQVQRVFRLLPPWSDRCLMVGVLASAKTIAGIPNRYPQRYPAPEQIPAIWQPGVLNALHYHDSDPAVDLLALARRCRLPEGGAMQLNIAWPAPEQVARLAEADYRVILQVGARALEQGTLSERIPNYQNNLHYVLLDLSGGTGRPLQQELIKQLLQELREIAPGVLPVVAGGLGPDSLSGLCELPLARLSIDAESRVRTADDQLDLAACGWYLAAAVRLLRGSAECPTRQLDLLELVRARLEHADQEQLRRVLAVLSS